MPSDIDTKLKTLDELEAIVRKLKGKGRVVVQCHGVFDLLHPGHIRHFHAAREFGDVLIVTLTADRYVNKGPGRPVFNQRLRAESLAALQAVDYVAIDGSPTAVETIKKLMPDVYVKGSEYAQREEDLTGKIYDEEAAIVSVGGRIAFTDDITFSSTELLNNYFTVFSEEANAFLRDFRQRYTADDILGRLKQLAGMRVLVIGDTIIDEYHFCRALGKPSKSASISAKFLREETYAGGVLAIANHLAGFCNRVHLITCLGEEHGQDDYVRSRLKPNVTPRFFYRPDAPTIVKRRFVDPFLLSKMFEVCFLNDEHLPREVEEDVRAYLQAVTADYDLVVVADYGHGFLGPSLIDVLCSAARFLAVNVQTNSANAGFNVVSKYPRADYVCVDEEEMRLANRDKYGRLEALMRRTARQLNSRILTVTRGTHGSISYESGHGFVEIPVFSDEVVDTVGAGDAFLSIAAPCAAAGEPTEVVGFIGNAVGALAVRIVGNKESIEPVPLFKFITTLLK